MCGLTAVPIEVMHYIVHDLSLDDLFNLSLSCRQFHYLIRDQSICKTVLMVGSDPPAG
jgi:hypothetical protein